MDQPTEEERLNFQPVDAEGRRRRADQDRESITFKEGGILENYIYKDTIEKIMALDGRE